MAELVKQGHDICACGDFRSQHSDEGPCNVCGGMTGAYNGCRSFRFAQQATAQDVITWLSSAGVESVAAHG